MKLVIKAINAQLQGTRDDLEDQCENLDDTIQRVARVDRLMAVVQLYLDGRVGKTELAEALARCQ